MAYEVTCPLSVHSSGILARKWRGPLRDVHIGNVHSSRDLGGDAIDVSVSRVVFVLDEEIYVIAQNVDIGRKAEAFRLCMLEKNEAHSMGIEVPNDGDGESIDISALKGKYIRPAVLTYKECMQIELVPGKIERVDVYIDRGLLLVSHKGASCLVEHHKEIPLNVSITTSADRIYEALQRSVCIKFV
ncbi:MAG: hypothetical protein WDZ84_10760 [Rhodovibrionaceae bacterium]